MINCRDNSLLIFIFSIDWFLRIENEGFLLISGNSVVDIELNIYHLVEHDHNMFALLILTLLLVVIVRLANS